MSLSLSQLFEQHQEQYSSKTKNESAEDGGIEIKNEFIDSGVVDSLQRTGIECSVANANELKKSGKRKISTLPSGVEINSEVRDKQEFTNCTKRIKVEFSNDTNGENDDEIGEKILDAEGQVEEHNDREKRTFQNKRNFRPYENYSEILKALYNFKGDNLEQPYCSEALDVINSALSPSKNRGDLTRNKRRPGGEDEIQGEGEIFLNKSLSGRYRPRKRRVKSEVKSDVSYRLETQEEVQDRVKRMEEYTARSALRVRWKHRFSNFQSEEDIGDAFLHRAEQNVGEKLRADENERRLKERKEETIRRKERKKEELEEVKRLEAIDVLEEDDEVKEQSHLLAQLSQQEPLVKEEVKDLIHPDNLPHSNSPPSKLNYWEMGYSFPRKACISNDFDPSVERIVQSGSKGAFEAGKEHVEDNHDIEDGIKASFTTLMRYQNREGHSSRFFFEPNRTFITAGNNTFRPGYRSGHIHHMLSMAAKCLCGSPGTGYMDDIKLENYYFRLLCLRNEGSQMKSDCSATICSEVRKKCYFTALAEDLGKNMLLYLQNSWNDPVEVAKQLGILDCFQESPIRGNLLKKIRYHSKNLRSQLTRSHKIRSIAWNYDNSNDGTKSDEDSFDEEISEPKIEKTGSEITSDGGVVDFLTQNSSMTINRERDFAPAPSKHVRDAFISPNTLYYHIAGTKPPNPQRPLYPSSLLFGPVDRYSKFYHSNVRMDSSICKIMLSTLMNRISGARVSNNKSVALHSQKQIMNLIEEFANINENKFHLRYTNCVGDNSDTDIPLVEFYRGMIGYCTYMANGYLEMGHSRIFPEEGEQDSPYRDHDITQHSGMNLVAAKIWEFCRSKVRGNALLRFPRLRIIFGIALICRSLSTSAAEILSRPIDDDDIRTPLDLFKQTLLELESSNYITSNQSLEGKSILALELEFLLHDAAEFFHEAVELDPTNVENQLWHIGCLASCLLISSGNKISDSVHIYPSQIKGKFVNHEAVAHEVRPCMKKYNEVRIELSTAMKAFFTLAKYQDSPKVHFAAFSLLEWGQVIGLLVGSQLNQYLIDINRLHIFHFGAWAQHEPAAFLREYSGMSEKVNLASLYAQVLENDPGKINNWRNFVLCLGPVFISKNQDWWGKDRCWWGESLLYMSFSGVRDRPGTKTDSGTLKNFFEQLKNATNTKSIPQMHSPSGTDGINEECNDIDDHQKIDWLPTPENILAENDNQGSISFEHRTRCYAKNLPRTKKNISGDKHGNPSDFLSSTTVPLAGNAPLQGLSSLLQEAQAYKIFILCHLFGADHPSVHKYIYFNLFCKCVLNETFDKSSDEFRIIVWLKMMGIHVEDIINDPKISLCWQNNN